MPCEVTTLLRHTPFNFFSTKGYSVLKERNRICLVSHDRQHIITFDRDIKSLIEFKEKDPECFTRFCNAMHNFFIRQKILGNDGDSLIAQLKIRGEI